MEEEESKVTQCCSNGDDIPELPEYTVPDVEIEEVTKIFVDEDGVFDKYMNAGYKQLERHYNAGRIKGADFTQAHLQSMQVMIDEANKYVLAKYQIDAQLAKLKLEMQLIAEQIVTQQMQQKKLAQDISLSCMQEAELSANGVAQRAKLQADMDLTYTQREEAVANGFSTRALQEAQKELTETQTSELVLNGESKRALEAAQTAVAGAQEALYEAQATGFRDKAKNDAHRNIANAWAISVSEMTNEVIPGSTSATYLDRLVSQIATDLGLPDVTEQPVQPAP